MKNMLSLLLVLGLSTQGFLAADKYWRPLNSDFHQASNWDPVGVPGAGDRVILDQFGQMDMIISTNVSVAGWLQYNNYFEEVYITNGSDLTVGSQNFFMDSGGFYAGAGTMDINGHFEVHGGGFSSPETALYVQGDFEINPVPLGGWFTDNTAHYELDGFQYSTLIASMVFPNLTINKSGGYTLTIPAGLFIRVDGYAEWLDGFINGDGLMRFAGDTYIGPGSDGGNCLVQFTGSGEQIVELDKQDWNVDLIEIDKYSLEDTTRFVSLIPDFKMQTSGDTLRVKRGICVIDYFNDWNLHQAYTYLEPQGVFVAPEGNLDIHFNWTNNGGSFLHNQGTVVFEGFSYGTMDLLLSQTFYNLKMAKDGGYSATVANGDFLVVENRMDFESGYLNGILGTLQVEDTLYFGPAHVTGNCPVEMTSDKISNVIIDEQTFLLNDFEIRKDNPSDTVYFETSNALLQTGTGSNRLDIHTGVVAFKNYGTSVDWNLDHTQIHSGGTLLAPVGELLCSGNLTESGGSFKHNMGHWTFDSPSYRTLDVSNRIEFYTVEMDKSSGYALTVASGDSLVAINKYLSRQGYLNNTDAWLIAEDSLVHTSTHLRGSIPVRFGGNGDGHWIANEVSNLAKDIAINKGDANDRVWVSTDLTSVEIGEADEVLTIEQGILAFGDAVDLVEMDFADVYILPNGTFEAFSGKTSFSGNLIESGGTFDHNMGLWEFYLARNTSLDVTDRIDFYNVEMDRPSSYSLTIANGDSLVALNKYTSVRGYANNALARLIIEDSLLTTDSHQRGSLPIHFGGDGDGHWLNFETGAIATDITVHKNSPDDKVWIESGNPVLEVGESDENLTIKQGQFGFLPVPDYVNFDFGNLYIESEGVFEASSGLTRARGSIYESGGSFEHNQGTWQFDQSAYATLDVSDRIDFWNAEMNKSSGYSLTIASGDSLMAMNRMTFFQGYTDNADARVVAMDSVVVTNSHLRGSAPLVFAGEQDGTWIHDETAQSFTQVHVRKENGARVDMHSSAVDLDYGYHDESISLFSGVLEVNQDGGQVDWGPGSTTVSGGTLALHSGLTIWTYNLSFQTGQLLHRDGTVRVSNSAYSTFDLTEEPLFGTFEINKSSGYTLTLAGNARLAVENQLNFLQGYANSGTLVALGGADVGVSYLGGSSTLSFEGTGDQFFDLTGAEFRYEGVIRLDKAAGKVLLTSNLEIEDNSAQLDLQNGLLGFEDANTHRVIFGNGVSTGWSGGNNNSYVDGSCIKYGSGTMDLPVGNGDTFAPIGVTSIFPASASVIATYVNSPPVSGPLGVGLDHVSGCEYWEMTQNTGAPIANVRLSYDTGRCGPIDDPAALRVASWTGTEWEDLGQSSDDGYIITSASSEDSFTQFTLASANGNNPMNTSSVPCPNDLDGSGFHDTADLLILLGEFGCSGSCSADLDGDGGVGTLDLLTLLAVFGTPCP